MSISLATLALLSAGVAAAAPAGEDSDLDRIPDRPRRASAAGGVRVRRPPPSCAPRAARPPLPRERAHRRHAARARSCRFRRRRPTAGRTGPAPTLVADWRARARR